MTRSETSIRVHAPGRVNLIGEHTDYTGGLVFPIAIDRGITIEATPLEGAIRLCSDDVDGVVELQLPIMGDSPSIEPGWGSFVAAVAAELETTRGIDGEITTTIPTGAGLSSSAALECALALALGFSGSARELAQLTQRAEHRATGVPTGIMDQYCIAAARAGHATKIDCSTLEVEHVAFPNEVEVVVRFVAHRTLLGSEYSDRVAECGRAATTIGPLRHASIDNLGDLDADPVAQRRARHVVGENQRVLDFAEALRRRDFAHAGELMSASHTSLRDDFEVSTPAMDAAVETLLARPGVYGARLTGGGFGGCVIALCEPGSVTEGWRVRPADGARALAPSD